MRRLVGLFSVLALVVPINLQAQARSPEMMQLSYFVGTWTFTYEGTSGTWECDWFGDTFVQCAVEATDAAGNEFGVVDLFAYDVEAGVFSWNRFPTTGAPEAASGWFREDTWTFVFDQPVGAMVRASILVEGPDVATIRWGDSVEGGDWVMRSEIKMTRVH